jgi:anti-sigma regulatory factor (Ser/Thr protein kinase)
METVTFNYDIDGDDFISAGEASTDMKQKLRKMGINADIVRRSAICMYEGEINMVIHANGGHAEVHVSEKSVKIVLEDSGPGIDSIEQAMSEGFSTATHSIRELGFGAGMGLPNMKKNSDEFYVESVLGVGTKVTAIINLT